MLQTSHYPIVGISINTVIGGTNTAVVELLGGQGLFLRAAAVDGTLPCRSGLWI